MSAVMVGAELMPETDVEIDRETLLRRAVALAHEGDVMSGLWFATMAGERDYELVPLRLPVDLARRYGFEVPA